ncbi:MAG: Heimdall-CTERM domain-containing surface protein [Candidatus Hodarchaeota archaeon]
MRKKYSFIIATSIFLLLLIPSIGMAEIDKDVMKPGDTFIYEVTKFDIPWADLMVDMESPIPLEGFVFDLSGSTLGVKVMAVDARDGFYALNYYVVLGESIEIPFPEDVLTTEIEEVFGTKFTIPEGVGIGLGSPIHPLLYMLFYGSDFLDFIESDFEDYPGFPFYLDPNAWDDYEDMFDDFGADLKTATGLDLTVDNEGDEFTVTIEGDNLGPDSDIDVMAVIKWHRTGSYEGVFKSISADASAKLLMPGTEEYTTAPWETQTEESSSEPISSLPAGVGSVEDTISVEISFDNKRYNPLPKAILDEEIITLTMDTASISYETEDFFAEHPPVQDWLDEIEDQLDDAENEDFFEFEVLDVEGCYYETAISMYDGSRLQEMDGTVWWNGFVGSPGYKDEWTTNSWDDWLIYPLMPFGIIPVLAPGITPDWDMWQASTYSISSIIEVLEKSITSSDSADELAAIGFTLDEFDLTYEMRGNKDYKFFYFTAEGDLSVDVSKAPTEWFEDDPPTSGTADVTVTVEAWLGYTSDGLIVSMGADLMLDATFEDFPFGSDYNTETYQTEYYYDNGYIKMELTAEIVNEDIDDIPDPTALPKDTEGEDGAAGGITPGFSIIPVLVVFAAVAVIIKRRK